MTSNEQARADAMADAETLRQYVARAARRESAIASVELAFGKIYPAVNFYYALGDGVRLCPEHYGLSYAQDWNAKAARGAAHAIFSAVPDLRG